jgi:hypothetical protein
MMTQQMRVVHYVTCEPMDYRDSTYILITPGSAEVNILQSSWSDILINLKSLAKLRMFVSILSNYQLSLLVFLALYFLPNIS